MSRSTGQRLRFEIFKRDGFRCLYCGATPVQKVLRVDHVVPVVEGGKTTHDNLVTACFDCNAGKSGVPLDKLAIPASVATEADREHAEQIYEWLKISREIDSAKGAVVAEFVHFWEEHVGYAPATLERRLRTALDREGPDAVRLAIERLGSKDLPDVTRQFQYFYGVLRGIRQDREQGR